MTVKSLFLSILFLFACNRTGEQVLESKFHFENTKEILSLHGNWKLSTNPDFNPTSPISSNDFKINYIPRMWFNSGIKDKYIVSYTSEISFSEDVQKNKFGVLVFNAINSNETYINGKLIGKKGIIDKDKFKIVNNASPSLYPIPEGYLHKGKNQITIRIADNAASGGFLEAPRVCEISVCEKSYNRFLLITGGTGFFMLFIGVYHLFLYLGNRKEKAILYFGAGTICHALTFLGYERVLYFFSEKFLIHFYTMNPGYTFSCLLAVIFIHSFLEKKINLVSKFLFICFSLGVLSTLVAGISLDYRAIHSRYILLLNVMGFVPILSLQVINLTLKALKEKKVGSSLILFGFVTFMFTTLLVPLHLLHIIPTKPFTLEGSLILITSVTLALSQKARQTSQKLLDLERKFRSDMEKEVSEKTKALELKNQELNTINLMKDKLFSIIAHDLRNPLFALEEVISLFQDEHLSQEALKKNILSLGENLENNKFLLENLLQWSYIQLGYSPLKLEEIDIQKLISESIQLYKGFALKKRISIQIISKHSAYFYGDEGIIRLILRNLISNAIKFTPQKGRIQISYGKKNSSFYFSVTDTGIGISKKQLKNLLVQTHIEKNTRGTEGEGGSGIGLALCKDFAKRMNGTINIKSIEKKGSTFTMTWEPNET